MTFGQSIQTVLRKYAEFEGRAGRPEFWWWVLFSALVTAVLDVFAVVRIADGVSLGSVLTSLWGIAVLLPTLAVGVRRLRDAGLAWTNLFWLLLPIAGIIVLAIYWARPSVLTAAGAGAPTASGGAAQGVRI
jgi:uncharacterized membrane protein YhaH (DUF805 family)